MNRVATKLHHPQELNMNCAQSRALKVGSNIRVRWIGISSTHALGRL